MKKRLDTIHTAPLYLNDPWLIKVHSKTSCNWPKEKKKEEKKIGTRPLEESEGFVYAILWYVNICVWGSTRSSMKDWVYQTLTKRHLLPNPTQYSILNGRAVKFPIHFPTLHSHHTFNQDPKSKGKTHYHFTCPN